jgi:hypothetical protein
MLATLSGVNQIGDKVLLHVVDPNSDRAFFVDKAFKGDFHELAARQIKTSSWHAKLPSLG